MGEVKRYINCVVGMTGVEMVRASDYATLEADRDRLKVIADNYSSLLMDANAENAKLRAELERRVPDGWWQVIHDTLREYRMSTLVDEDGDGYPLIDAMTADSQPVSGGIEECTYLADAIWNALLAAAPSAPKADPVKVQLLEALEYFVSRKAAILAKFDIHGPADIAAGMRIKLGQAEAAIAAARKGEGE